MIRRTIRRIVPRWLIDRVRTLQAYLAGTATYRRTHEIILYLFSRSKLSSAVYYFFFSRAFRREQHAVLNGRWLYTKMSRSAQSSEFLLRRNIHRLEKGLISRPRRSVFARAYIGETVESYMLQLRAAGARISESTHPDLCWAGEVLERYFTEIGDDEAVAAARHRFEGRRSVESKTFPLSPFKRGDEPPPVSYEDLQKLARRRRSIRWFQSRPVPRDLIDKALKIAVQAPSACNRQPYSFRIFDEPDQVQEVGRLALGASGFVQNFPAVAVLVGQQRAYFDERDRHVIYIDASLAAMSFLFALETVGLSSCCLNWPDRERQEKKMEKRLDLAPDERVVMLIAIGYPDPEGLVPASGKKHLDTIRRYNE